MEDMLVKWTRAIPKKSGFYWKWMLFNDGVCRVVLDEVSVIDTPYYYNSAEKCSNCIPTFWSVDQIDPPKNPGLETPGREWLKETPKLDGNYWFIRKFFGDSHYELSGGFFPFFTIKLDLSFMKEYLWIGPIKTPLPPANCIEDGK